MSNYENCNFYLNLMSKYSTDILRCKNMINSFKNKNSNFNFEYHESLLKYKLSKFKKVQELFLESYNNIENRKQKHRIFIKSFDYCIFIKTENDSIKILLKDATDDNLLN